MPASRAVKRSNALERDPPGTIPIGWQLEDPFLTVEITLGPRRPLIVKRRRGQIAPDRGDEIGASLTDLTRYYERVIKAYAFFDESNPSAALTNIARIGQGLFQTLFNEEERRAIRQRRDESILAEKNHRMEVGVGQYVPPKIHVIADQVNIPWEFVYIDDTGTEPVVPEGFLGTSFFIQQNIFMNKSRWLAPKPMAREFGVQLYTYDDLPAASGQEIPTVKRMLQAAGILAEDAPALDGTKGTTDQLARSINSSSADLLHFACHAGISKESGKVEICVNDHYTADDLEIRNHLEPSKNGAFVFLNCCELSTTDSTQYNDIISEFLKSNFSSIIATEIEIDDTEACNFSEVLYDLLLNHRCGSLQNAVFHARRIFREQHDSYVGYTYSYYGNFDLLIT
ncbi:CHAT domain-containing protein [uncultured Roseobacter sp.]|uniref:CHAT domain-containing protein n=1 Tax=uncultured Roseobacter sp. TaxID=114847 RepID=UPI0026132E17|nr:CHAT domain-containing protein [uncultured Roseobacter sp.]